MEKHVEEAMASCTVLCRGESDAFFWYGSTLRFGEILLAMERIEKTVFLSYRRTNVPWAYAIYEHLTKHGYDVFVDFKGIASGDFESVIVGNITTRAHFIILLSPTTLESCHDPADWVRREIETALSARRNIVPVMVDAFDYKSPGIADRLTGNLAAIKSYNALRVPHDYFEEAMKRLREEFLNISLTAVPHPERIVFNPANPEQTRAVKPAPAVRKSTLTAHQWLQRASATDDIDEQLRCYDEAIRLDPDEPGFYLIRGNAKSETGDFDGAIEDYSEAIKLDPDDFGFFFNRGLARNQKGEFKAAIKDFSEVLRQEPEDHFSFNGRGKARNHCGDFDGAIRDLPRPSG